jgi:hypothetical protein
VLIVTAFLLVPAAAQATGPASFIKADGGVYRAQVYPAGGLKIYSTSPAYITLLYRGSTPAVESYASHNNFAAVAVRNFRGGRAGEDCFLDAHLIILPFFINDLVRGGREYHGLFMQYAKWFFLSGDGRPGACTVGRAPGGAFPSISLGGGSAKLTVDCVVRTCSGSFATFGRPSSCSNPVSVLPGRLGCLPDVHGSFTLSGGLSGRLAFNLFGRPARSTIIAIIVNGKQIASSPLSSLRRTPVLPRRPTKSSLSETCTSAPVGSSATVSGSLTPRGPSVAIALTFAGPAGASSTVSPTAAANGRYSARFVPSSPGAWTVTATFDGDRSRRASSRSCHFVVAKRTSAITLTCPPPGSVFTPVQVSGTLAPAVADVPISLTYTPPLGGAPVTSTPRTNTSGAFSDSSVTPGANQPGKWSVTAAWTGNATTLGASASCSFTVA